MRNSPYIGLEIPKEPITEDRAVYKNVKAIFSAVKTLEYQMNTIEGLLESLLKEIKRIKDK